MDDTYEGPVNQPAAQPNRPTSFGLHIAVMFNENQRLCMSPYLDLGSYEEVKANAESIYKRVEAQDMPADETGPWPNEWLILFRRWIDEGCAP